MHRKTCAVLMPPKGALMDCNSFVDLMCAVSLPSVFNPYADECELADVVGRGAGLRRATLTSYLGAVQRSGCDTMWMGRDLGYRGGRRTGLALTDEANLGRVSARYPGATVTKATRGAVVAERTAAEIWSVLMLVEEPPLLWNVFPFHPHEQGKPLSNRKFTTRELSVAEELNRHLVEWLGITRIVAIGQDAATYARRLGLGVVAVRHPSYGGVTDFRRAMADVYDIRPNCAVRQLGLIP